MRLPASRRNCSALLLADYERIELARMGVSKPAAGVSFP